MASADPGAGHAHSHAGPAVSNQKRLGLVLALAAAYMIAEVIGGLVTNSLALLADAGHMLSDVGSLALALAAMWMAGRPAGARHTYGYYRTEILAALANGAVLVAVAVYIFIEAYGRLGQPPEVQGGLMLAIASGGLAVNLAGLWLLNAGKSDNLNLRGAWLHVLTDMLGSVGAIVTGLLIWAFGWHWTDPVASVLIGLLVLYSAWPLLKQAGLVLLESAPGNIDVDELHQALAAVPGVSSVHDLHVWTVTSGLVALSAHVCASGRPAPGLLAELQQLLRDRFGIDHVTIQIESEAHAAEEDLPV